MLYVLVAILGLAVLMIVHEAGHYFAARASGLRVLKFSIGFGPTLFRVLPDGGFWTFSAFGDRAKFKLFKHDPEKHGETVFQVAVIPFLAYVQIAGMNPLEENDPNDKGSYANASLRARVVTIFAGPLANYVAASFFFFLPLYATNSSGDPAPATMVNVVENSAAAEAGLKDKDIIVQIDGDSVEGDWKALSNKISGSEGKQLAVVVLRDDQRVTIDVTPRISEKDNTPRIGVAPRQLRPARNVGEVALAAISLPPKVVQDAISALGKWAKGSGEAELAGPVRMVDTMAEAVERGWEDFMFLLGVLSTSLAVFNMMPIPALDGGRLLFLGYEATTRRRPNPTVEAHIHAICLLMMLGLMLYVTLANDIGFGKSK